MKFNKSFSGEPFENYRKYLETVRDKFPEPLYDFVSNPKRHDLEEKSLHDSWINEILVKETRNKKDNFWETSVSVKIELLGPYHDRIFELNFDAVSSYQIGVGKNGTFDLITYEIYCETIDKKDFLIFNAEFADDSAIIIKAQKITITEKLLS